MHTLRSYSPVIAKGEPEQECARVAFMQALSKPMEPLLRARHCARLGGRSGEPGKHSLLPKVSVQP